MEAEAPVHPRESLLLESLLLAPYVLLSASLLFNRSVVPEVLGLWSKAFAIFLFMNTLVLAAAILALVKRSGAAVLVLTAILIGFTYVHGVNNDSASRITPAWILLSRFALAILPLRVAYAWYWKHRRRGALAFRTMAVAIVFFAVIALDGLLLAVSPNWVGHGTLESRFRSPVKFEEMAKDSIAIVGDSFVWGLGVEEREAFPARLQTVLDRRSAQSGTVPPKVYNLGILAANFFEYRDVVARLGTVRQIVVCTYPNDIPDRQTTTAKVRQVLLSLGRTGGLFRLATNALGMLARRSTSDYMKSLVADWEMSDPTFELRWATMMRDFEVTANHAVRHSRARPILVIFPLLVDFRKYPLRAMHERWKKAGQEHGFEVVDTLPLFEREFTDGERFVAMPDDFHFNAAVHARLAEWLAGFLAP